MGRMCPSSHFEERYTLYLLPFLFMKLFFPPNFRLTIYFCISATEAIEKATEPKDLESKRMKRVARTLKDPLLGYRFPEFLQEVVATEEGEDPNQLSRAKPSKMIVFRPSRGSGVMTQSWATLNWPKIGPYTRSRPWTTRILS